MVWMFLHDRATPEHLGFIPEFLSNDDPRPAVEQIHERYAHGGGWTPFKGFEFHADKSLRYPGDPTMRPLAVGFLRPGTSTEESIYVYESGWTLVERLDGTWEIARLD
jgi:hypothetical protein